MKAEEVQVLTYLWSPRHVYISRHWNLASVDVVKMWLSSIETEASTSYWATMCSCLRQTTMLKLILTVYLKMLTFFLSRFNFLVHNLTFQFITLALYLIIFSHLWLYIWYFGLLELLFLRLWHHFNFLTQNFGIFPQIFIFFSSLFLSW